MKKKNGLGYVILNWYGKPMHFSDGKLWNGRHGSLFNDYELARGIFRKEMRMWHRVAKENKWPLKNFNYPFKIISVRVDYRNRIWTGG